MSDKSGYEAFISYKHNPIDTKVAKDVQKRIEHYRIPKDIQKKTGIQKFRRVFRDTSELSGSADLPADIENALRNSDYLIVICSKRTYASRWVVREIEMFLENHDIGHVLTVLVDGEPHEVIPEILLKERKEVVALDGTVHVEERELEPLSCDYRNGFRVARNQEIPRLASRFLGCDYDDLYKRELRDRYRRFLTLFCIITGLSITATSYLLWSMQEIRRNYNESVRQKQVYAAKLEEQYLEEGRREAALKTGISSIDTLTEDERLMAPELLYFMEEASRLYNCGYEGIFDNIVNTQEFIMESSVSKICTDVAGKYICCCDWNKNVYIWSVEQKKMIYTEQWNTYISEMLITDDELAIVASESTVCCIDCETGEMIWKQKYASDVIDLILSSDPLLGILTGDSIIWVDLSTANIAEKAKLKEYIAESTPLSEYEEINISVEAKSPNMKWLAIDISTEIGFLEYQHFKGIFDIQGHQIYVLDEEVTVLYGEEAYGKSYITNDGDLFVFIVPDSDIYNRGNISRVSITDGVLWTREWKLNSSAILELSNRISMDSSTIYIGGRKYYGTDSRVELVAVIGSRMLVLDADSGEVLKDCALPARARLYIGDSTYFLMPGMIGYENSGGGVTFVRFPVGDFDDFKLIEEYDSWNQTEEIIFANGKNVYIYQKTTDNPEIVRYETTSENASDRVLWVASDGLIEICSFEDGTVKASKYASDNSICVWSAEIPKPTDSCYISYSIIGENPSGRYIYLSLESGTEEKTAARIDINNGDVVTFVVPDRHYQTEPYEMSSIVGFLGAQKEELLYYTEWYDNMVWSCAICRYNANNQEVEEHVLPFGLNYSFPGRVLSDNQLVCYSEQNEIYVFNTDTWEYVALDDEYEAENYGTEWQVFSPGDGMYAVCPAGGNRLDLFVEDKGRAYTVGSTSEIITAYSDEDTLYVLYSDGILTLYNLEDGSTVDRINLDCAHGLYWFINTKIVKVSDNELIVCCSEGVYVLDLTYKVIRTYVPAGIGYDAKENGFYLDIHNKDSVNSAWVRRYSASEVIERARKIVGSSE